MPLNMNTGSSAGYKTSPEPLFMMWQFIINSWWTSNWDPSCSDPCFFSFSTLKFDVMDLPQVMRPPAALPDTFKEVLLPLGLHDLTVIVEVDATVKWHCKIKTTT